MLTIVLRHAADTLPSPDGYFMNDDLRLTAVRGIGITLALLSLVVLAGWYFDVEVLKAVVPGLATMKPETAACFFLTAMALWLVAPVEASRGRRVGRVLGMVVTAIGALTVLEYRLGWNSRLDALFFPFGNVSSAAPAALRMSEMTAIAFIFAGAAALTATFERAWRWTLGLAIAVGLVAVTALVAYVYDVEDLYAVVPYSTMALHTSLAFGAVAVGLALTTHRHGLIRLLCTDSLGGLTARWMLPVAIAVPFTFGLLRLSGVRRGWFPVDFGTALFAVFGMVTFAGLVWGYAAWIDRFEGHRRELEGRLLRAQKLKAAGQVAVGVAHDFNNVLSVVTATVGLLQLDHDEEPLRSDLRAIHDAADRATSLTRQLLTFGRQEVVRPRLVSLNEVVRGSERLLRRLVPEHVSLTFRLADGLGTTWLDPGQVDLILVNLLVNAAEANPDGGRVTVETRNTELDDSFSAEPNAYEPGSYVGLIVTDNGSGMDADTVQRIFEPFFSTKSSGTGLGLATVHDIVTQNGGTIRVYSEPGHGTTFKIYFPRSDAEAQPLTAAAQLRPEALSGDETVLVVEDNDTVRTIVRRVLERHGYSVLTARHGINALEVDDAHPGPLHIMVTDVVMPEMGGPEVAARLERRHPEIRTVFMSGYADQTVLEVLEDDVPFLEKPFTPVELLSVVRKTLDESVA